MKTSDWNVCKICVMVKGLKGKDLVEGKCPHAFKTEKELMRHLQDEHNIKVGGK